MLVLSRKKNEDIVIETPAGEVITLKVVDIRGDKIRLGVAADKSIQVHRREVYETIQAETKDAA